MEGEKAWDSLGSATEPILTVRKDLQERKRNKHKQMTFLFKNG